MKRETTAGFWLAHPLPWILALCLSFWPSAPGLAQTPMPEEGTVVRNTISLDLLGIETGKVYQDITFTDGSGKTLHPPCWVWIPAGATTAMPLTVFMHGSEQTTGKKNLPMASRSPQSSLPLLIEEGVLPLNDLKSIVLAPHRSADTFGRMEYISIIEAAARLYGSDMDRIALSGFSWGGAIAYDLTAMAPDLFSAVFIASSGPRGNPDTIPALARMDQSTLPPMMTMITREDTDFPYRAVTEALKPLGDKITIITMEGGHYEAAYASFADPMVQAFLYLQ